MYTLEIKALIHDLLWNPGKLPKLKCRICKGQTEKNTETGELLFHLATFPTCNIICVLCNAKLFLKLHVLLSSREERLGKLQHFNVVIFLTLKHLTCNSRVYILVKYSDKVFFKGRAFLMGRLTPTCVSTQVFCLFFFFRLKPADFFVCFFFFKG